MVAEGISSGDVTIGTVVGVLCGYGLFGFVGVHALNRIRSPKDDTGRPLTERRRRRGANYFWTREGPDKPWRVDTSAPEIRPPSGSARQGVVEGSNIIATDAVRLLDPEDVAAGRGLAWANAAARFIIALSIPALFTVAFAVAGIRPGGWWVGLAALWALVLVLGTLDAWETLNGVIDGSVCRVDPDYTVLVGPSVGPLRRSRVVRLDEVARIRFIYVPNLRYFLRYLLITDIRGGRLLIEDPSPGLRRLVIHAIAKSPHARVGYITSRRLAGLFTWWTYPLSYLPHLAITLGIFSAALEMAGFRHAPR